jgi:hypothetical protein
MAIRCRTGIGVRAAAKKWKEKCASHPESERSQRHQKRQKFSLNEFLAIALLTAAAVVANAAGMTRRRGC